MGLPKGYKFNEERPEGHRRNLSEALRTSQNTSRGPNHPRWKGGQYLCDGYVYLSRPDHPRANKLGYVKRANLVMEGILERFLLPGEMVHHEGERDDDRSEMLIFFPSQKDHLAYHRSMKS